VDLFTLSEAVTVGVRIVGVEPLAISSPSGIPSPSLSVMMSNGMTPKGGRFSGSVIVAPAGSKRGMGTCSS